MVPRTGDSKLWVLGANNRDTEATLFMDLDAVIFRNVLNYLGVAHKVVLRSSNAGADSQLPMLLFKNLDGKTKAIDTLEGILQAVKEKKLVTARQFSTTQDPSEPMVWTLVMGKLWRAIHSNTWQNDKNLSYVSKLLTAGMNGWLRERELKAVVESQIAKLGHDFPTEKSQIHLEACQALNAISARLEGSTYLFESDSPTLLDILLLAHLDCLEWSLPCTELKQHADGLRPLVEFKGRIRSSWYTV